MIPITIVRFEVNGNCNQAYHFSLPHVKNPYSIRFATLLVIPDFLTRLIYEIEVVNYNVGSAFPMFIGIQASSFTNVLYIGFCRDADYDFSMGACLHALHSSCPGYVVESTAADIVNVLQRAVKASKSAELQVRGLT